MKPYPSYKDSGVEWIGKIPNHWEQKKVKYLLNESDGIKIGPFGSSLKLDTLTDSGIKIYGQGNLIKDDFNLGHRYLPIERFENDFLQYEIVDGDVLVTMMGTTGKSKVFKCSYERGILDSHLLRLRFNKSKLISELFTILLEESDYLFHQIKLSSKGSIMEGLNSSIIKELQIIKPPLPEQQQIVSFLDHKTQKIDELVEKTGQKINLLKEKRTSLIDHCVTKGLNPDVEMKDSGVEWIGDIPSHWKCGKLKHLTTKIGDGLHSTPFYVDESDYYFVNGNNLKDGKVVIFDNTKCIDESEYNNHFIKLNERTLLLSINGTIGNVSFYNHEKIILGKSICYIKCSCDINHKFVYYLIQSDSTQSYYIFELTGTTIFNLSLNSIRNTPISLPDLEEQNQIVEYLDEQTQKIDTTIEKESRRIELLKEYRQTLISDVVTGKIDVREEV